MSLTVFVDPDRKSVVIVRWFLDPEVSISYPCAPLTEMPLAEFRTTGYDWVQRHFSEFATKRVCEDGAVPPFSGSDAKRRMQNRDVVEIRKDPSGELRLIPAVVREFDLGRGLEILERDKRRSIPANTSQESFWHTFDEVLSFSHDHAV